MICDSSQIKAKSKRWVTGNVYNDNWILNNFRSYTIFFILIKTEDLKGIFISRENTLSSGSAMETLSENLYRNESGNLLHFNINANEKEKERCPLMPFKACEYVYNNTLSYLLLWMEYKCLRNVDIIK